MVINIIKFFSFVIFLWRKSRIFSKTLKNADFFSSEDANLTWHCYEKQVISFITTDHSSKPGLFNIIFTDQPRGLVVRVPDY